MQKIRELFPNSRHVKIWETDLILFGCVFVLKTIKIYLSDLFHLS